MEDLTISGKEHKLWKKFQRRLEKHYNVEIRMPKVLSLSTDIVFISLFGNEPNRKLAKNFILNKMNRSSIVTNKNVLVVTLSDSEEESSSTDDDKTLCLIQQPHCTGSSHSKNSAATNLFEDSVIIDEEIAKSSHTSDNFISLESPPDDSVIILGTPVSSEATRNGPCQQRSGQRKRKQMRNQMKNKKAAMEINVCDELRQFLEEAPSRTKNLPDFIPLPNISKSDNQRNKASKNLHNFSLKQNKMNKDDIILEEPVSTPRLLRPVVIDGCNVAIEHGQVSHSFSSKGIKLAIDYFLNRGHTQVTAFVPKFRRFNAPNRNFPTQDPDILEDLAKKQLVVFTPSRKVNGKFIQSYDDRFIVQLASTNGGVIVSNDNYRDLLDESDSFKEAIEQRLLMFCFVGDNFMVPEDPLGRNGPKLSDYLCFPLDSKKTEGT